MVLGILLNGPSPFAKIGSVALLALIVGDLIVKSALGEKQMTPSGFLRGSVLLQPASISVRLPPAESPATNRVSMGSTPSGPLSNIQRYASCASLLAKRRLCSGNIR